MSTSKKDATNLSAGINSPNGRAEIEAMFGNPANHDGTLNLMWEQANIQLVKPPVGWKLLYQSDNGLVPISGIRMHRMVAPQFAGAMKDIWACARNNSGAANDIGIRKWLNDLRLDQTGGGFNFRKITAGTSLSLHAYGIAIDWDPAHNPRKKPLSKTLPEWWYDIWVKWGFSNGCHFSTPDPMHVQFATGA